MLVWELLESVYCVVNAVVNSVRIKIEYQAGRGNSVFLDKTERRKDLFSELSLQKL